MRLEELRFAVTPTVELTVRLTVSENPFTAVTVIVVVPEEPTLTGPAVEGLAAMLKSTTVTIMAGVAWEIWPLAAVTVTV